jgi:hypothetical protein
VIGVGGAARISSVKGSCVAAAVAGGCHDTTGWDAAMVTPPDIEARILRLYHAEKWLIGTIAQQLCAATSPPLPPGMAIHVSCSTII